MSSRVRVSRIFASDLKRRPNVNNSSYSTSLPLRSGSRRSSWRRWPSRPYQNVRSDSQGTPAVEGMSLVLHGQGERFILSPMYLPNFNFLSQTFLFLKSPSDLGAMGGGRVPELRGVPQLAAQPRQCLRLHELQLRGNGRGLQTRRQLGLQMAADQ